MDPAQYQRVREHFLRIRELPEDQWQHEIDAIEREDAQMATQVRDLLGVDTKPSQAQSEDLFERAIQRGVHEAASSVADSADDGALSAGDTVGAYTVQRKIGEGGFGDVYLASQSGAVSRTVALKVVKHGTQSRHVLKRFNQERQALALMNHPNIARLYDAGATPIDQGARPYFAMEYVQGPTLTDYARRQGLTIDQRLELFIKVCAGVQHAHAKGVMHRDLKPSNILVSTVEEPHEPKVIDFGIAKALDQRLTADTLRTEQGQLIGTLAYMSPEQAAGQEVDTRSDVYALGVVLYELLTGTLPIDPKELAGMSPMVAQKRICESRPERPSTRISSRQPVAGSMARDRVADARALRSELDWIVMRCLEKEPNQRYATPDALAQDLRRYLEGQPVWARPPSAAYQARKFVLRHKLPVSLAAAFGVAIIASAAILIVVLAREARTRVERDDYEAQAADLRRTEQSLQRALADMASINAQLQEGKAQTERINVELRTSQKELESQTAALEDKSAQLLLANGQLNDANARLDEANKGLFEQREALAATNESLNKALDEREAAILVANRANEELQNTNAQLENARALAREEAQRYETLFKDTERSVGVLTEGSRLPTDVLRQIANELGTQGVLQGEILEHLARRTFAAGDIRGAVDDQERAYRAFLGKLGSHEPKTIEAQLRLADMLQHASRFDDAQQALDLARRAIDATLPPGHPLGDRAELAAIAQHHYQGDHARAIERADALVQRLEPSLGRFHASTLAALRRRAMALAARGETARAEADYRRVIQVSQPAHPDGHDDLVIAKNNLGVLLRWKGDETAAQAMLAQALIDARAYWGNEDWRTGMVKANHAGALAALEDFDQAIERFEAAYQTLADTVGPCHPEAKDTARAIIQTLERWNEAAPSGDRDASLKKWRAALEGC